MKITCNVPPPINDYEVMAAITRALAPLDSGDQKEWTCVAFDVERSELERIDSRVGSWEICPPSLFASKLTVSWRFYEKMIDRNGEHWVPCIAKTMCYLDPDVSGKIEKELGKCRP